MFYLFFNVYVVSLYVIEVILMGRILLKLRQTILLSMILKMNMRMTLLMMMIWICSHLLMFLTAVVWLLKFKIGWPDYLSGSITTIIIYDVKGIPICVVTTFL